MKKIRYNVITPIIIIVFSAIEERCTMNIDKQYFDNSNE